MHEGDADINAFLKRLADSYILDETFTLKVGESCRIRDDYVEKLPSTHHNRRFKLFYKRTDDNAYHWLDSEGNQGVDAGPLEFYVKHWEKI